jgi:hypothetical protein
LKIFSKVGQLEVYSTRIIIIKLNKMNNIIYLPISLSIMHGLSSSRTKYQKACIMKYFLVSWWKLTFCYKFFLYLQQYNTKDLILLQFLFESLQNYRLYKKIKILLLWKLHPKIVGLITWRQFWNFCKNVILLENGVNINK